MKRVPFLMLVLVFGLVSCSPGRFSSPDRATDAPTMAAPSSLPATATPWVVVSTAAPPEATVEPTVASSPTVAPTPVSVVDTFDQPNDAWSDPLVVTSQAGGRDPFIKITVDSGRMRFAIQDKETYVYKAYNQPVGGDTTVQVTFENRGVATYGVAIICKADQAMTTWYEARLVAEENKYDLYAYDKKLKEEAKNPYTLLASGVLALQEFSPFKETILSLSCTDKELKLDVNNGKRVVTQPVSAGLQGNRVGIGVMSYNLLPVNLDIKSVAIN